MKKVFSLKGKICFKEVYEKGKRQKTGNINAAVLKNCRFDCSSSCIKKTKDGVNFKIAVITGKKFGKAYERNRARRRIRAVLNEFEFTGNFCMSLNVYNGINNICYSDLKNELEMLLSKTGVLKNEI